MVEGRWAEVSQVLVIHWPHVPFHYWARNLIRYQRSEQLDMSPGAPQRPARLSAHKLSRVDAPFIRGVKYRCLVFHAP